LNEILNEILSQYENKRKVNKLASKFLQQAQLLQASQKMMSVNSLENIIDLISRVERVINSNCILLSDLPIVNDNFPLKTLKTWILLMVPHLKTQLRVTVKQGELTGYL